MKHLILISFLCITLLGCTQDHSSDTIIQSTDSFALRDNGIIGKNFRVYRGGEDAITILNMPGSLFKVDLRIKGIANTLDSLAFDIDSLIGATYQKRNAEKILYSKHTEGEILNKDKSLFQIYGISEEDGRFYIPITITAEASYLNSEEVKAALKSSNVNIDSILQFAGAANIRSIDFLYFLLVTDENLKIKEIQPLYGLDPLTGGLIMPSKNSYVLGGQFLCPLISGGVAGILYDTVNIENNEPPFYFQSFEVKDLNKNKSVISKEIIDGKKISQKDHLTLESGFCIYKNHLISVVGNQLVDLTANKLVHFQPELEDDEQITDISTMDNTFYFMVSKRTKLPDTEIAKRQFGTSREVSSMFLIAYNTETGKVSERSVINKDHIYRLNKNVLYSVSPGNKKSPVVYTSKLNFGK